MMFNIKTLLGIQDYTSELDQFLATWYERPLSASQQAEREKYKRIFRLRDQEIKEDTSQKKFLADF